MFCGKLLKYASFDERRWLWYLLLQIDKIYWVWRLSIFARPWFALKTFLFLHWNARKTATHLDDCMRAMGQMHHSKHEHECMFMPIQTRHELTTRAWKTLPTWRWRDG